MLLIYGHLTEIIVEDERSPMPAGFGIGANSPVTNSNGNGLSDDSVYIIAGNGRNFNNGNGANANTNGPNVPVISTPMCTLELQVSKKLQGHCIRLGKSGHGCVSGEHMIPYHPDCM